MRAFVFAECVGLLFGRGYALDTTHVSVQFGKENVFWHSVLSFGFLSLFFFSRNLAFQPADSLGMVGAESTPGGSLSFGGF